MTKRPVLVERLVSPATQQSHEEYLLPRNCWFRMTNIQILVSQVEKAQKLRLRVSVPNSARVVRTSFIQIDSSLNLQAMKNSAGFADIPIDVIVLCEYKHDVRCCHQNSLDFDVEIISSKVSIKSKSIGTGTIDLSNAIQNPLQSSIILIRKDNNVTTVASVQVQRLHSLCISKTSPPLSSSYKLPLPQQHEGSEQQRQQMQNEKHSMSIDSDSESETLPTFTKQFETAILNILSKNHIVLADERSSEGQLLLDSLVLEDFSIPINELNVAQFIFDVASREFVHDLNIPFRFFVAGDDIFVCSVLKLFISMRDRGIFPNDAFSFIYLPLAKKPTRMSRKVAAISPSFASFFGSSWFELFSEEVRSKTLIQEKVMPLLSTPLASVKLHVADVLITTDTNQFTVPMLIILTIGDPNGDSTYSSSTLKKKQLASDILSNSGISMRGTFSQSDGNKALNFKSFFFSLDFNESELKCEWKYLTNANIIPKFSQLDKFSVEKKKRQATRVVLALGKGQTPVSIKVDGRIFRNVVGATITLRDSDSAIILNSPQ